MRHIDTMGVIGASKTGRRFAFMALMAGYRVILEDVFPEMLEIATGRINRVLDERMARNGMTVGQRADALARLSTETRVENVCRVADMLIDTVMDEMEAKLEIFTIFEKFAKPSVILASSTFLSITEIACITSRTEDCVGMRLVEISRGGEMLEIVRGVDTSEGVIASCAEVGQRMNLQVRVVRDAFQDAPAGAALIHRAKGDDE